MFRDRQLTNANMKSTTNDKVRVIKSRNITDDGKIIDIENYDAYIDRTALNSFSVSKYIDEENVYLTPNMTYKTRVMKKPKGTIVNGSVAILIPKFNKKLTFTTTTMPLLAPAQSSLQFFRFLFRPHTEHISALRPAVFFRHAAYSRRQACGQETSCSGQENPPPAALSA